MKPVVTNAARSSNGCWTCRVRKKKCDETQPSCFACVSFELNCCGYGPKPKWMDNGVLQQEQAAKIKSIVSQTSRSKRRKLTKSNVQSPGSRSSQDSSPSIGGPPPGHGNASTREDVFSGPGVVNLNTLDESMWATLFDHDSFMSPALSSINGINGCNATSEAFNWEQPLWSPIAESTFGLSCDSADTHRIEDAWMDDEIPDDILTTTTPSWTSSPEKEKPFESSPESVNLSRARSHRTNFEQHSMALEGLYRGPCGGENEDMLFMHYLDQVFYIQYPFYDAHDKQTRGWLFSMLKGGKSAYQASLALSEHHLLSIQDIDTTHSLMELRSKNSHYHLAYQEMELSVGGSRWWNDDVRMARSIETLACILQLLFLETFAGGTDNWQKYLRIAATLLPAIVQLSSIFAPENADRDPKHYNQQPQKSPTTKDGQASDFLLGSFVALDIISSASTRSKPFLDLDHQSILQNLDIDSRGFLGCDTTIMILISEISQLDNWRKDAIESQKLSIVELAKRGSQIEHRIRRKITKFENTSSFKKDNARSSLMRNYTDISRIHALAAIVYLHVVISGAHPELPEVKEGVSKTLAALQSLSDKKLLVNAVWAFCITGCLAVKNQQDSFRELFSEAKVTKSTVGTFTEAFKVMETCWEMRGNGSCSCDWVSAMDRLGRHVLLR